MLAKKDFIKLNKKDLTVYLNLSFNIFVSQRFMCFE